MSVLDQWLYSMTGAIAMPMWLAGAVAALAVFASVLAFMRVSPAGRIGIAWRIAVVMVGLGLLWILVDSQSGRDATALRRSLESRSAELTLRALTPGSPLACLDNIGSPTIEDACERALFASPETVAAAVAYVEARLGILADGLVLAAYDRGYAFSIERHRRALEGDRYGIVAHVFASRGCTATDCEALKMLRSAHRVTANLHERQFDANVVLHAAVWKGDGPVSVPVLAPGPGAPPLAAPNPPPMASAPLPAQANVTTGSAPTGPKIDFPSSASIPAISIMNAEPPLPPGEAAASAPLPNQGTVPKPAPSQPRREVAREATPLPPSPPRPQPQQLPPQAQTIAPPPMQVAPPPPPQSNIPRWGSGSN